MTMLRVLESISHGRSVERATRQFESSGSILTSGCEIPSLTSRSILFTEATPEANDKITTEKALKSGKLGFYTKKREAGITQSTTLNALSPRSILSFYPDFEIEFLSVLNRGFEEWQDLISKHALFSELEIELRCHRRLFPNRPYLSQILEGCKNCKNSGQERGER
jgi:hypothetical protein